MESYLGEGASLYLSNGRSKSLREESDSAREQRYVGEVKEGRRSYWGESARSSLEPQVVNRRKGAFTFW